MQAVTRWFVRYAVLFLLLFLAGLGYAAVSDRYGNIVNWPRRSFQQVQALEEAQQALETDVRMLGRSYRTVLGNAP